MLGVPLGVWLLVGVVPIVAACSSETTTTPPPGEELADDERGLQRRELLGKRLFEDTSLSEPPGQACATCHDAARAFGSDARVSLGAVAGETGSRNSPSVMYARFVPSFSVSMEETPGEGFALAPRGGLFWDGRAGSLEEQAMLPLLDPHEMANPTAEAVVRKVREGPNARLFAEVFAEDSADASTSNDADSDVAFAQIASAIAAYQRTARFTPFSSRFDDWLRGEETLSDLELRGLDLFQDRKKGNCVACHTRKAGSHEPGEWLFTGWTYEALGVPRNNAIPANDDADHFDLGLCGRPNLALVLPHQIDVDDYCGAFRVPSLRNVAVTGPYMHNGFFTDLAEVVRFYATRDTEPERWYPRGPDGAIDKFDDLPLEHRANVNTFEVPYDRRPGQAPHLDDGEVQAIVAFLETLTDR